MSRLTRDGTAEPVSRDQILRHARGQGNVNFPCSADHEQDWRPYPVDPYSAICDDHTYVAWFDGGGEIFGFGAGGYKESWSWCSLFVEYPSLFVATSGEKPALRFRPRAVVAGRGVVAVCTRISSQEYVYDK